MSVMDATRNPYTPNAGAVPPLIAGRDDLEASFRLLLSRLSLGRSEQSMIITGLRGVGKTVLLEQFRQIADAAHWVVIDREISKHDDIDFRRSLTAWMRSALLSLSPREQWDDRLRHALSVLRSFSLSVDPDGRLSAGLDVGVQYGVGDQGVLQQDVVDLFVAAGEAAAAHRRGIVLLLDEIQFLNRLQLESLIIGLHKAVQRNLPVTLVGAGLPQIPEMAGDAKSYAERLFVFPQISNLPDDQARIALHTPALVEGVRWTDAALAVAVARTEGYPYFLQELGYAAWLVAHDNTITALDVEQAIPSYEDKLDSSFFRVRLDRATELQRAYLRAMAELGPGAQKAADVASLLGRASNQVGPTRSELTSMGLLFAPQHGYAAFTVPQFDRFLKRAIPEFIAPPIQRRQGG